MTDFVILGSQLSEQARNLESLSLKLFSESENIDKVISAFKMEGAYAPLVRNKLMLLKRQVAEEGSRLRSYGKTLSEIEMLYERAEKSILQFRQEKDPATDQGTGQISAGQGAGNGSGNAQKAEEQIKEQIQMLLEKLERDSKSSSSKDRDDFKKLEPFLLGALFSGAGSAFQLSTDKVWLPEGFPTRKDHYNRNQYMSKDKIPQTIEEAERWGWDNNVASDCHQFTSKDKSNIKYVSPDGKYEVIFDSNGNIVTADEDCGTYNFANPKEDYAGHFYKDVLPWILWGNSPDDSTTPGQRLDALIFGGGSNLVKKAATVG